MDALKYVAGKKTGQSGIILHGDTTLLVSCPPEQPFNPETGKPNPPVDSGMQMEDILAMQKGALEALDKAQELADACDVLVEDAEAALDK